MSGGTAIKGGWMNNNVVFLFLFYYFVNIKYLFNDKVHSSRLSDTS
jgi:hypothetical protein